MGLLLAPKTPKPQLLENFIHIALIKRAIRRKMPLAFMVLEEFIIIRSESEQRVLQSLTSLNCEEVPGLSE